MTGLNVLFLFFQKKRVHVVDYKKEGMSDSKT